MTEKQAIHAAKALANRLQEITFVVYDPDSEDWRDQRRSYYPATQEELDTHYAGISRHNITHAVDPREPAPKTFLSQFMTISRPHWHTDCAWYTEEEAVTYCHTVINTLSDVCGARMFDDITGRTVEIIRKELT
jgi:hypothetical protein